MHNTLYKPSRGRYHGRLKIVSSLQYRLAVWCGSIVRQKCDSNDDEDGETGEQRRGQGAWCGEGARRFADVARVLAAAERARRSARRRQAVVTRRQRLVQLQTTGRVHRAYLVDGQLLAHVCNAHNRTR